MQEKFLHVSTFNARSICNKLPELHRLLYHETRHVVLITETWLNKKTFVMVSSIPIENIVFFVVIVMIGEVVAFVFL